MKIARRLLFFFLLCLSFAACSLLPNELKQAESLIETAPDSALHILQHLSPDKYKSDESRALYGLLMIQALDKKLLPLKPDSLLDFSIAYYQEYPHKDRLAKCYFYKARMYKYRFQYEFAINSYLRAQDIMKESVDNLFLGKINFDLGDIYLAQREYVTARNKYQDAYGYFLKCNHKDFAYYCMINIGKSYSLIRLYKKAFPYFYKVYKEANDSLVKGLAIQNIGMNFYKAKQYPSALRYLREVLPYPCIKTNKAIRYYYLADLFLDLNQIDSAYYYATNSLKYGPDIRIQKECYRIIVNCKTIEGNIEELNRFMVNYQDCADSIQKIDTQTKGSYIETMHTTKQEVVKTKSWLWYLFYILIVVVLAAISIYIFKHKRNIKDRQLQEENHIQQKAGMRKDVLLKHRDGLLKKIEDRKKLQAPLWKKAGPEERAKMDHRMYEELLHFNDIHFFYKEMDTVLNGLVTKLNEQYSLNEKEIQWCCLSLLNISGQDIMLLLSYNSDSFKKMKQRLAKKLGVASVPDLEAFLYTLLTQ